jgi:septal ring factor EnvC (AmiA/AmiB activator)
MTSVFNRRKDEKRALHIGINSFITAIRLSSVVLLLLLINSTALLAQEPVKAASGTAMTSREALEKLDRMEKEMKEMDKKIKKLDEQDASLRESMRKTGTDLFIAN